jgi:hypothetical protein
MDSSRLRFPRLNLARSKAKQLAVFGTYEMTDERLALLPGREEGHRQGREGPGIVSFTRYKPRGVGSLSYSIAATSHVDNESNEIHVSISYRESPADAPRPRIVGVPEGKMLEIAQAMGVPSEVGSLVLFEFADREPNQLWFPLPVSLSGKSPEDTIEVRGVRAVKIGAQGGETEYEFILDRPAGDQVVLQIELRLEGSITPNSIRRALQRAEYIAEDLVAQS